MTRRPLVACVALVLTGTLVSGQTKITAPSNKYAVSQDVELGRKAAEEARQQLPIMKDDAVQSYVEAIGRRLVDAIPPEFQHAEFKYTFEVVNVREINAFALPGGPMFVNRGMIEAAHAEGEVAGVMAHEISHVILRHGTAQASKATKYEVGTLLGAITGAVVGGQLGNVISTTTQFGIGTAFLKFGRDFEKQADIEGSHLMADAGYDPRDMANMFKTIENESKSSGPQWLSDHPNPGNRYEYILKEAASLRVTGPAPNAEGFDRVRAHLKTLSPAPTTEEATKTAKNRRTSSSSPSPTTANRPPTGEVAAPSSQYRNYTEGNVFQVSVPANWRELASSSSVTFAPEGGYGTQNGRGVFTHGIEFGLERNESHDLRTASEELVTSLTRSNSRLSQSSGFQSLTIDSRQAFQTTLGNVSEVTGRDEVIRLVTTQTRNGNLLYAVAVAPRDQIDTYDQVFQRVIGSMRLRD